MTFWKFCFVAFALVGCSGAPFSQDLFGSTSDGGLKAIEAANATGGESSVDSGAGGAAAASGGATTATGGTTAASGTGDAAVAASGGTTSSGDDAGSTACTPVTHSNGVGQTWQDCVPLGTHNEDQALAACKASAATQCLAFIDACGPPNSMIRGYGVDGSLIVGEWLYSGGIAGTVSNNGDPCSAAPPCPGVGFGCDLDNKHWN